MYRERKDNKGRILQTGESQKPNGKYIFKYVDPEGNRRSVSSWRLLPWDIGADGTTQEECLRDMEIRVRKSLIADRKPVLNENATVNDFWEKYLSMKVEIAESTLVNYIYLYDRHIRKSFGNRKIMKVKYSDVKKFYIEKLDGGLRISSIKNMQNILGPVFELAYRDGYIDSNPTKGIVSEFARRKDWSPQKREALTAEQQSELIRFISESYRYRSLLSLVTVLLGTGMRIGEALGLRWEDVDFVKNTISVNHTLNYDVSLNGRCEHYITFPKTKSGVRDIPMLDDVRDTLLQMYKRKDDFNASMQIIVDGYTNFIFRDIKGKLYTSGRVNENLKSIIKAYNKEATEKARKARKNPSLMPYFTCHHLRHTFCTNLCLNKVAIKTIQYIMGHSHPETTLSIYAQVCGTSNQDEMARLNGILKLR